MRAEAPEPQAQEKSCGRWERLDGCGGAVDRERRAGTRMAPLGPPRSPAIRRTRPLTLSCSLPRYGVREVADGLSRPSGGRGMMRTAVGPVGPPK